MTLLEFLTNLEGWAPSFQWRLEAGRIRANQYGFCSCPITAVYSAKKGTHMPIGMFYSAAASLGLPKEDARAVVQAADDSPGHSRALRAALLEAVGLTPRNVQMICWLEY